VSEERERYLWTRMSAAWRTGYENRPSLREALAFSSRTEASSARESLL
jgi:hypothetical protein